MTTPTDERPELLTVIAYMRAKPGKEEELKAALQGLIPATKAEDGCVNYDLNQSVEDPRLFFFYENWASPSHLDAHLAQPHLVDFAKISSDLLDDGGLSINRLRRIG